MKKREKMQKNSIFSLKKDKLCKIQSKFMEQKKII